MNTVMVSFDTTVRQTSKMSQRKKNTAASRIYMCKYEYLMCDVSI